MLVKEAHSDFTLGLTLQNASSRRNATRATPPPPRRSRASPPHPAGHFSRLVFELGKLPATLTLHAFSLRRDRTKNHSAHFTKKLSFAV
jgi:hypothetical protein